VWIRERQGSGVTSLKAMVNRLRSAWTARAIVSDDTPTPPHCGNLRAQCQNGRLIAGSQTSICRLALQRYGNPVILIMLRSL